MSVGKVSTRMGIMHAIYGVGALCSPLVSTQFVRLPRWNFVYLTHVGLVALNALAGALVFRFRSEAGPYPCQSVALGFSCGLTCGARGDGDGDSDST